MIRLDPERRRDLVAGLRAEGQWSEGVSADLMERLLSTTSEPQFPGAVIPRHMGDQYCYYLVASSEPDWRMLRPLAVAFVGRTISTFDGAKTEFDERDQFEALLLGVGLSGARVLATGSTAPERRRVAEVLDQLRAFATVARGRQPELRTTTDILRDFRLALAIRDRAAAEHAIDQLRGNLRLDGLNQIFMRIELDAALEAWPDLWGRSYYADACHALRPPRVSVGLARAAYWTALAETAASGDLDGLLQAFRAKVAPRCEGLFSGLPPSYTPDVVLPFLLGWELASITVTVPAELRAEIGTWPTGERAIAHRLLDGFRLPEAEPGPQPGPPVDAPVVAELNRLVFAAVLRRTPDALEAAHAALTRSGGPIVEQLRESDLFRDAVDLVLAYEPAPEIRSWIAWAAHIPSIDDKAAAGWAREALGEHPIWEELANGSALAAFVGHLDRAMGDAPESAGLALPFVLEAVLTDPEWPRVEFRTLYRSLLDLLLYDDRVTPAKVASASRITAGLLAIGLESADYSMVVRDLGNWVAKAASALTLDRLIDLGEVTVTYPCPDETGRRALWAMILLAFRQFQTRLDSVQLQVLTEIDAIVGGEVPLVALLEQASGTAREHPPGAVTSARVLAPKIRVALYSLVESMARRTKDVLENAYPSIEVQVSTGVVADRRLEQQAREADLFVICWTRATHAATNAIRSRRGDRPLLYASGAGSASLTREIVERLSALGLLVEAA